MYAAKVYMSSRVYELASPWQTSSTTPDIQRTAGWRHEFSTWLSRRIIVSPVVNAREETAGVPLFLSFSFSFSSSAYLYHVGADDTPRGVHSMTHSRGEKHISDCLYQLGICGWWLSPAENDTCKIRIVKRRVQLSCVCAGVYTHVGMIALLHGAETQMDPCG